MALREAVQAAVEAACKAAGNLAETARYESRSSTAYNASAGVASVSSDGYFVSMLFSSFTLRESANLGIQPQDVKAKFPQSWLSVAPQIHDRVHRIESEASVPYAVVNIFQDGAAATWTLQLRRAQ